MLLDILLLSNVMSVHNIYDLFAKLTWGIIILVVQFVQLLATLVVMPGLNLSPYSNLFMFALFRIF